MFEAHVLYLLKRYLGEYVEGLSTEALRVSVWQGDVVLKDLKLKAEALNSLKLPVTVKAGFVGTITLKVPWKSLGKDPVVVLIDRVFVLAHPAPDGQTLQPEDREKLFQAKLQQIEERENATLEATNRLSKDGSAPPSGTWLGNLIATIIGNLKVTISNVHIRYEDSVSNPGHPFCSGITLSKLAAVTVDEQGKETFDTSAALDKLRKSLQLHRLALYHDSDSSPWKIDKKWEDLNPAEWSEIFQDGIDDISPDSNSAWALNRTYLVSPINGVLKYHRLGKQERVKPDVPFEKASLVLTDVSLTVTEAQYYDGIKLLETFSRFKTRVDVSHLRPSVPVLEDPRAWWRYAMLAGLRQKKLCYFVSWERIKHHCQLRRRYVQLYAAFLQQSSTGDASELRQIERTLDSKIIILWRLLAHAKVESVKSQEASRKNAASKRSWWPLGWYSSEESVSTEKPSPVDPQPGEEKEKLTKEEWQAINKLLSFQEEEGSIFPSEKGSQNIIKFLLEVSITKGAARIVSIDNVEVICGRFEDLFVETKLRPKSIECDVKLKSCGLSSPEGTISKCFLSEEKSNALVASFVHCPIGQDLDWKLSATIAPCHVTVSMVTYERFLEFVKRSNAISPTIAMETATALQVKLEQVTRRAQEQLQMVLEEQSRFQLEIDLDAPKVWVPLNATQSSFGDRYFILDFGHFKLERADGQRDERQSLYSRFTVKGRDMAVFYSDSMSPDQSISSIEMASKATSSSLENNKSCQLYSFLDPCGMSLTLDQIKVFHPRYPSTRISVEVPKLGLHFSPERYRKITELLDLLFYSSSEITDQDSNEFGRAELLPWYPADLTTNARILVWRGIGNSVAEWQPCHLALSGLYLYVLESEFSRTYQRCCSISGRYIFEVPSASVGGSLYAIAVSSRGIDIQKALESTSTLIIEFQSDAEKAIWMKELVQVTYRASASPDMYIPGRSANSSPTGSPVKGSFSNLTSADFVLSGTVVETKLSIYGKLDRTSENAEEELILGLLGKVATVNLMRYTGDLTIKTKLHSLKIQDMLQSRLSKTPQYLAISVINEEELAQTNSSMVVDSEKDSSSLVSSLDEDSFKDALPEFTPTPTSHCGFALPAGGEMNDVFYEATDDTSRTDFVVLSFFTRSPDYHLYDGIDTQMSIRMTTLEFYCNRPTVVAMIDFGLDVSMVNYGTNSSTSSTNDSTTAIIPPTPQSSKSTIKGLLGYGKGRVVFDLKMDVDQVSVFLNKEDGTQLAMFVQEQFLFDLKVHPSSISINGTLGNTRICDMSLGPDHQWGWLCDTKKQGGESLIKFTFQSYSAEDDDYQGYDYSLTGQLSAVRIVFLYRFVQEFMSYFMELASPHTEEAIKLFDKVGGFKGLVQKYEIDGATAVKLDLSLDTPIIIVPKDSHSKDYMQLDLGKLKVKNHLSWHGDKDNDDHSAVHLDILHAEIDGINMAVGVDGVLGKPMVRQGQNMHIEVRRSLRDVYRNVPTMSIEVQIGMLHGVMSDNEYNVISTCITMNLCEIPNTPPSFRENPTRTKESIKILADKVNHNSQLLLSKTVFVIGVDVQYALLELYNGPDAESPLAQIALEGIWVSYRTTSLLEMDLFISIPKFSILDIRPDTKPEMRLMLGSHSETSNPNPNPNNPDEMSHDTSLTNQCNLTMLIMDFRWRSTFQSFVIRIQQPRVLVMLDFLLEVVEYFVPSLGTITGREEASNPKNDPLTHSDDIIIQEPVYYQRENVVHLSPAKQLIVDGVGWDEFVYDGCGGVLSLSDEFDKRGQVCYGGTIIMIGAGKRLRFKNVKIENGALLKKCTYLNNGSSYSVAPDDGVEISLLDSGPADMDEDDQGQFSNLRQEKDACEKKAGAVSNDAFSFNFEAQIVSPELTFYDSSKLLIDDSLNIEKLLRAKLDFSFMYVSKGNDIFSRLSIKDLTVEAGSGLVVLEPMDISGSFSSVKERISFNAMSTDICIRLSLAVSSLLLKLQNQTISALQFGNINPLVSCTNFEQIWVSPKGDSPGYNLTFWRPQPPPNYAILGDCVTSKPVPPTKVVVAVSNTYGRVRKATGFTLICTLSGSSTENDCSIWAPIPPAGYSAVGCVAHVGRLPPPNHLVYCLRSDLVTSSKFSDCIYYLSPQQGVSSSGFSIWRTDNVLNSFHAHNSVELPQNEALDLHQILLRNPNSFKSKIPDSTVKTESQIDQSSGSHKSGSGWDVVRSLSKSSSYYTSTPHFERMWWDKGSESVRKPVSIWRPVARPGFAPLGDCILEGMEPPTLGLVFKCDANSLFSARPKQYTKVAQIKKGSDDLYFWYPVAPTGYTAVGCVVTRFDEEPKKDLICCPRIDLVSQGNVGVEPISRSSSSKGSSCWSIWRVENQASTFLARPDLKRPAAKLAYSISDYVKPKARENVHAELKLGFLSVSILDSSCGTMTPLLDATVTNINFTSQGRYEAMGAVLLCSISASTFNRQLEAWEPLIEPFDGIFKLETYDVSEHPPKVGKRVRVAAATPLNLNVTSANLETLIETWVSWNRQIELETLSSKKSEEAREKLKQNISSSFSAINEDDFQKVIIENKLGCDVYFKRVEEMEETIGLFSNDSQVSLLMPPPRFTDKLNVVTKHAEARYYVAIQIFESEGLPIVDDGNNDDYLCALRLLMDSNVSDQNSLFPQSARTRCVKPQKDSNTHVAKWNELFIFEVPEKGLTHLEVEVTNLGSRAGKGDIIGAVSIPVGRNMGALKRASSIKVFHHAPDFRQATSYPLMTKGQKEKKECGKLVLSTCFIERNIQTNSQTGKGLKNSETEVGFSIGLTSRGPWESFGSVLPLSTVPKSLNENHFAFEVSMQNGKKHATLRALAVVSNDSNVKLELSLCPVGMVGSSQTGYESGSGSNLVVEEVFENQRYQPISGWGKIEPWKWSTRDFSHTSKDFFEPPLPAGWKWASGWRIEKSQFVDSDGWAYAPDFPTLKWPPNSAKSSSKSPLDFARRRRWIRTRQQISSKNTENDGNSSMRRVIGVVNPQSSMVLPWTSMVKGLDLCLQIRPFIEKSEKSQEQPYSWGQSLILSSSSGSGSSSQSSNNQSAALRLSQLKERDTLFYSTSTAGVKQIFWFSAGVDASALHTELNEPVPDWNISVNSIFRLENKLPFEAEYALWEKKNDGNLVERQHGIVGSGGCAYVYSADVRKNIYLTMFVQGGWSLEKDVTMIWDPAGVNNASSFWMVQKPSKRRLRVSIERDTGRSDAAPKTVRIFVPYWIENDCALPLSYRMVLVEPSENSDNDSLLLGRAVKSAKLALRYSSKALDKRALSSRRNVEILESIEDSSNPSCVMLSPQDYLNRSSPFQSRNENVTPTRVGISVAVGNSNNFSPGVSLLELETKERIDIRAFGSDGSYYRLAAQLKMASDRTKVLHFLPRTLFINRTGKSIILSQFETSSEMHLRPSDPPKQFKWQSHIRSELLKVRLDGYRWSIPFSIESDGLMCISLTSLTGNDKMFMRVQVRSSTKSSRFEVLFLLASISSPYRIENRSMFLPIRFRQADGYDDSWHTLRPNSSTSFFWEDLSRPRLLELTIDGSSSSKNYPLDESADHIPSLSSLSLPRKPLRVTIFKEGKKQITRITDFTPETGNKSMKERGLTSPIFQPSEVDYGRTEELGVESEFHVIFELAELGVSVVDHMPEEVMYLSVQNLLVSYSSGMGSGPSGISRFKVRMQWIQVDNQLPFSPMPVLFSPQRTENQLEYILKFSMTTQANNSLDLCVYPYIGVQAPENCSFLVNIHEPIIWRLHDMIQHANIGRLTSSQAAAVSVDPIIKIGLLNISEIRFRVSMAMSPAQRPRGALGFWASLMTALGNMEHMPVRIAQRFRQEVSMRQSSLTSTAVSSIQKDLLTQPLQLLSGVDILGNASSALSNMSKGMAALSMDKKFIMSRQKQDSKGVEDFGDVIREGGGALAKGFFRGVTGILTKPLEGAKATGVEGFVSGVGKGLIGAAAQPVSGVLDLLSKTTEGANAVKNKISSVIMAEEQLQRRRLPRVIGGDNLLRPFDEYKAAGQAILQLAECGTFLGQVDLFKVRGKFAFTDAYEDHFMLPKGKVLLVTHRRVLLLQQPSTQRRFNPARDPCAVIWDVQWDDLMTMELQRGAKDHPGSLPSRLILYLKIKPSDSKESVRVIKCGPASEQASKVYVSVQRALNTYGSNSTKDMLRKKVTKPYTPQSVGSSSEVFPREIYGFWDNAQDKNKNLLDSSLIIVHGQPIPD